MKYEDVLKRFVSTQAQLLQDKQVRQQQREQMLAEKAQGLQSFVPGMQGHSPEEEYTESEHNPFEESQEYEDGGIHIDPSKKGTFKAQATRMGMSVQEAASHILNNKEDYTPTMVKKANFAKNFAKEEGGMFTGDYEYPDGGEFDKPRFSLGMYASPEMGSSVSPSLNFEKGNFNANLSTNIPVETPNRYSKNLNVDANYNTGKFGNIGVSGSAYRNEEGLPAYNAGLRYEVPINDKLNFMLNADTSSFKNLKDNTNVSAGLRYTFEEGGGNTKTVKSKDGTITNVKQNDDGSKTVQVRTKDGKYSEKVIPMDYWGELDQAKEKHNEQQSYENALNYTGIAAYPAAIVSSAVDARDGNYGDAAIGLVPFLSKEARASQLVRRNAITKLVNMGVPYNKAKYVRPAIDYTTKALGLGATGHDLGLYQEGGPFNNPGFNALPEAVQDKIIAAMMYGGSF